ncbi:MAG TPA: 16S rRNA (cytidine(1402)-2'-O)-methyltransferase [Burkholderiales bacterium]|nr:16S rRNA (cytidine(1402)-2'-O)-methyltransferase [Burkholderiales bacterium]
MATPIGNLADVTLRALEILRTVDVVAAEDTRVTRHLLAHHGIGTRLLALHEHNERSAAAKLVDLLGQGKSVALVSDAGTPALSDPGALAVAEVRKAGHRVVPVPGASALLAAISVAGVPALPFCFHGFLPSRKSDREKALRGLRSLQGLQVFYEAPHRVLECVESMAAILEGERRIVIARELTKMFEQVEVLRLPEAAGWLLADDDRRRGEFVLLVEGAPAGATGDDAPRVLDILMRVLPLSQAVTLAVEITGAKKNELYDRALALKKSGED